jgi:hypothetical protein
VQVPDELYKTEEDDTQVLCSGYEGWNYRASRQLCVEGSVRGGLRDALRRMTCVGNLVKRPSCALISAQCEAAKEGANGAAAITPKTR